MAARIASWARAASVEWSSDRLWSEPSPWAVSGELSRSPVGHGRVEDVAEVVAADVARADDEQPLLLERSLDERGDVVLVVAELGDAARRVDVAHECAQHVGQEIRTRPPGVANPLAGQQPRDVMVALG